ncbi:MAG: hypothetical protein HY606_09600, partial [Planctomycetes bacterium]|nr:hypothetical protein [Planctomycetota bacterium]
MQDSDVTPLFRQYLGLKELHPDKLVLFQLGDFYELYRDDAVSASKILNITLTKRTYKDLVIPMAGFPVHTLDNYIPKLIKAGCKVVVCDQLESAQQAKGNLVKRGVTRVVSAGTALEELMSDFGYPKLMGICQDGDRINVAILDNLRRTFTQTSINPDEIDSVILQYEPAEIVMSNSSNVRINNGNISVQHIEGNNNEPKELIMSYLNQLGPNSNKSFSIVQDDKKSFYLDGFTIVGLEIFETQRGEGYEGTLLWAIDETQTSMGKRLLKEWLKKPLISTSEINKRHSQVDYFIQNNVTLNWTRNSLRNLSDIDR